MVDFSAGPWCGPCTDALRELKTVARQIGNMARIGYAYNSWVKCLSPRSTPWFRDSRPRCVLVENHFTHMLPFMCVWAFSTEFFVFPNIQLTHVPMLWMYADRYVNCDVYRDFCTGHNVEAFPDIRVWRAGKKKLSDGGQRYTDMAWADFLLGHLLNFVPNKVDERRWLHCLIG